MSNSGDDSPDWLRSFQPIPLRAICKQLTFLQQAQSHSPLTLSSDSNSNSNSHSNSDSLPITMSPHVNNSYENNTPEDRCDVQVANQVTSQNLAEPHAAYHSVWTLSSDSESAPRNSYRREDSEGGRKRRRKDQDPIIVGNSEESPLNKRSEEKSPKKQHKVESYTLKDKKNTDDGPRRANHGDGGVEVTEEGVSMKHVGPCISTSRLPLVLSDKVHRSKALVECEGESIDLSGDMGAVGRILIPDTQSENGEMYLDLKGTIYKTTIVPSRTFCIVSFGQSEAKIEGIVNDFIQLTPQSNVYEAETMVEGTLEGFSFDSEDESDRICKAVPNQTEQKECTEEQAQGKTKGKAAKSSGLVQKKRKAAGAKQQPGKTVRKRTHGAKKAPTKKR